MRLYKPEGILATRFNGFKKETLEGFMKEGTIVEAPTIKCDNNLNLFVDLGPDIYGEIPYEEFEYSRNGAETKSVAVISRVAKSTCFKVTDIVEDQDGKTKAILSRKQAQQDCYENYVSKLQVGQVIDARITHIEKYGAFCDIGCGLIALLPIEHFCVARIKDPKTALKHFKNLKVIVKDIDESGKILLTQKELLGTWEEEAAKFKPGDVVVGTVRLVEKYGIFVELTPNLAGLAEGVEGVEAGDVVSVFIKSIIPDKMKVKLLIVDADSTASPFIKLDYRIPEDRFVKRWVYSPDNSSKVIESIIVEE